MNQEPTDYPNNRLPAGVTMDMIYEQITHYIYWNVLVFGYNIKNIVEIDKLVFNMNNSYSYGALTVSEASTYFIKQFLGE